MNLTLKSRLGRQLLPASNGKSSCSNVHFYGGSYPPAMTAIDPKWPVAEGGMNRPLIVDIPSGRFWPITACQEVLLQTQAV